MATRRGSRVGIPRGQADKGVPSALSRESADVGHAFTRPELLRWALTHRSVVYEAGAEIANDPQADNEQLEFLGDAVLGMLTAEALFRHFPSCREGELTRLRATLVSRAHLGEVAAGMSLGDKLLLGRGEEQSGGRSKSALLANALEAVIAAVYLDAGLEAARYFVEQHIVEPAMPALRVALKDGGTFSGAVGDYKSALQELLQGQGRGRAQYVLKEASGPDHQKRFRMEVRVENGEGQTSPLGEAVAGTKKQAEQEAARIALMRLKEGS